MAFSEAINDLSHTDRANQPLKLCPAMLVWNFCGHLAEWEFLSHHMCVCIYGLGTAWRNEGLITESSGKPSKRRGRREESLSVPVRTKTRGCLSTSLLLRAAWERGLLIRTLIPDTPSACSVNFVTHCAAWIATSFLVLYIHSVQNEPLPNAECKLALVSKW